MAPSMYCQTCNTRSVIYANGQYRCTNCGSGYGYASVEYSLDYYITRLYNKISEFWYNYYDKILFVTFLIQFVVLYRLIQTMHMGTYGLTLGIPYVDSAIPFIAVFAIPYSFFFPLISVPFILAFKKKNQLFAVSGAFVTAVLMLSIIWFIVPTIIYRPEVGTATVFHQMVTWLYSIDLPFNCFPSGHVAYSLLASLMLFDINKKWAYWMIPVTFLIIISTVLIKQHYVVDIIGGIIVGVLIYMLVFRNLLKSKMQHN